MTSTFPNAALQALCDDNAACLETLCKLVARLSDADYARAVAPCEAGIGSHVRHVLDHYEALLRGVTDGHIDYDARDRDRATEIDRHTAIHRLERVGARIPGLASRAGDSPLLVSLDCGTGGRRPAASTLARELQFLVSHTVHHDALVAAAARALGVETERGFGVAPSTLKAGARREAG